MSRGDSEKSARRERIVRESSYESTYRPEIDRKGARHGNRRRGSNDSEQG